MDQAKIDGIFAILRRIHTAHWKAPKEEIVKKEIARTGAFVFRIGSNPWVAEIRIAKESVNYEINPALPERLKLHAQELKKKFEEFSSMAPAK